MSKTPTIFLKKEWGRLGPCYNVVAFSGQGKQSAQQIIDALKENKECWICIQIIKDKKVRPKEPHECIVHLIKIESTNDFLTTTDHIIKKAATWPCRLKNGKIQWPYCFKIKDICHTDLSVAETKKVLTDLDKYNKDPNVQAGFIKLSSHDCVLLQDYCFNQRKFKWKSAKKRFWTDFCCWFCYTFVYKCKNDSSG